MQKIGGDATLAMAQESDLRAWSNATSLNPARIPPDRVDDPAILAATARLKQHIGAGRARLAEFAGRA